MAQKGKNRAVNGMGNIRKKTVKRNGVEYTYWEGRFTTGFDPGTGKQIQKSVTGKTQKEVIQKIKEMTHQVETGTYTEPCRMTVAEFLDLWQNEYLNSIAPNTAHSYKTHCRVHIIPGIGAVRLSQLSPLIIQQFCNRLKNERTNKPLSPKSVHNIHGTLHRALDRAVLLHYIPSNPADSINLALPQPEPYEVRPMEDEEITRFIEAIGDHRYRLIYLITLFTGLREGEILGLSWDDINWKDHILRIRQQLSINRETREYCIRRPKNRKSRYIVVADAVITLLREQQNMQSQMRQIAGPAWVNEWNLVFTKEDGSHLAVSTVYSNYKRIVSKIDHGEQRFHDLRHSFASNSLENGDDIKTVQENLGHYSASFTLKQYAHVKKTMSVASAQRMDIFIQRVMSENS